MNPPRPPLLEVENLRRTFAVGGGWLGGKPRRELTAVDGVSLRLGEGETLGLVGESGCGKSTTGKLLLRLLAPTGGTIHYRGRDLATLDREGLRWLRSEVQMVFQDPYSSLNPRQPVARILGLPLSRLPQYREPRAREQRIVELMERVGLDPRQRQRYPHQFSGGQRQRIGIARALALEPRLLVLDEPVSALDVSIQAQILRLLEELQRELGLSYLLISHDLAVVEYLCERVAVMYLGRIVENAPATALFRHPRHPYTRALVDSIPDLHRKDTRATLEGDLPDPTRIPVGCRFRTRCPRAGERCGQEDPASREEPAGHTTACHFPLAPGSS